MKKNNLILIGCGVHAKNTYLPFLKNNEVNCVLIVDIKSSELNLKKYLNEINFTSNNLYFVSPSPNKQSLLNEDENWLDNFLKNNEVDGVIICTEPMHHKVYLDWALKNKLDIICEKPLSSYTGLNSSPKLAERIYLDTEEVFTVAKNNKTSLVVQCQRRYHPAYTFIYKYLREFIIKHQIPINFIDISSSNGIFNLPSEYLDKENHPYKYGYGKLMHSGYHFVDLFCHLSQLNQLIENSNYDKIECFTKVTTVADYLKQMPINKINRLFECSDYNYSADGYKLDEYGEIDIFNLIQLKKGKYTLLTGQISMLQNTVSKRSVLNLPESLHKKEGAIRKEKVTIELGGLLSIQVYAYQNHEKKVSNFSNDYFFEVVIHRNTALIGGKAIEIIKFDHSTNNGNNSSYNQNARLQCFVDFIENKPSLSEIDSHLFSGELLSIMLQNLVKLKDGKVPYYKSKIKSLYV